MQEGRIVKGIGGFYYVRTGSELVECKPRGIFRKDKITPLVGDRVRISLLEGSELQGVIEEILPRDTVLLRPMVANVEQCVVVLSVDNPKPDLLLLDRLLVMVELSGLKASVCVNKTDLSGDGGYEDIAKVYRDIGYRVIYTSTITGQGIDELRDVLKDRISVFAGLSGVGKSSLLNRVQPHLKLKTGEISNKLKRGKHTTRHAELLELTFGGMVVDTPGFSSLKLSSVDYDKVLNLDLSYCFPEFHPYLNSCRFTGCRHLKEPGCSVKAAVEEGRIADWRYKNYTILLEEIEESRRKRYD
jgi:ribosome biogenesis GTPase